MTEHITEQLTEQLRQQIDAVAMQAMLCAGDADSVAVLLASLSRISEQAALAGFRAIPEAVQGLGRQIQEIDGAGSAAPLDPVLSCISLLQQLVEAGTNEASKTSPASATPQKPAPSSIAADPELLSDFLVEAGDHLTSIEAQLLTMEREPSNKDAVHSVFRSFHTIKGLAGFLDLFAIREVAHEVETLLDLARNDKVAVTPSIIDAILEGADYLKVDIARVERELHGAPPVPSLDCRDLLKNLQQQQIAEPSTYPAVADIQPVAALPTQILEGAVPTAVSASARPVVRTETGRTETGRAKSARTESSPAVEARVVKVDIGKLDFLMDVVGELVIAQSMVTHDRSGDAPANPKLLRNLAQLTRITAEVQKTAMAMRMVPVGQLFKRSVRLVRDLMRKSGKDAELVLTGEEAEVDRNIVEELADPLMHMIRNAADHAIEPPEERVRAGKDPKGRIQLKAYHQAGSIMIEVADDGRGLDREKILKKARERGLIRDTTDASQLSDKEVFNLIFEPGFSTAEKVTDISGRGVGMDVVRKQIQRMRGRVDIDSKLGQGTTFHLKLPLTLAIIDGLVVGVGAERYIIPIYAVREMFRPAPESVFTVEGQAEMVLVRGGLLPVVRLYKRFGVTPKSEDIAQSLLVVVESETRSFCIVVDELIDTQEVVIKNLGETFRHVGGIAGGTILGDGRVGLILDIDGLFTGKSDA